MTYRRGGETSYEIEFERFFDSDPKWTPTSYREILALTDNIQCLREGKEAYYKDINFDIIPEKYKYLIDSYNELCKNS